MLRGGNIKHVPVFPSFEKSKDYREIFFGDDFFLCVLFEGNFLGYSILVQRVVVEVHHIVEAAFKSVF